MRNYLWLLACATVGALLAFTLFNYAVDPYSISGVRLPSDRNAIKPTFGDHHVLGKPFALARQRPKAVVFGTSRENHGINPLYVAWPSALGTPYNIAMDAANIGDIERLVEHAEHATELKQIVIALDFLNMFDAKMHGAVNFDIELLQGDSHSAFAAKTNALRYFASWQMLKDSVATLRRQDSALVEFEQSGRRNSLVFEGAAKRFGQHYMFNFSETRYFRHRINLPIAQRYSRVDANGQPTLAHLARILDRAAARNIDVKLFVTPVHARQLEVFSMLGLWNEFENWKRNVIEIANGGSSRATRTAFEVWDFADYTEFSTEPVPIDGDTATRMHWYWESSHYTEALGNLVLDRIFGRVNPDLRNEFGVSLNRIDIEAHLASIRARGEQYRATHARDMIELQNNAAEVVKSGIVLSM